MTALILPPREELRAAQKYLNESCGVGFWEREDAEYEAFQRQARTGQEWAVVPVSTARRTHTLWFVRAIESGVAA